jgi:hypothetical protein
VWIARSTTVSAAATASRSNPNGYQAAVTKAQAALAAFHLTPGSTQLRSRPATALAPLFPLYATQLPYVVTRTTWWKSPLSINALGEWALNNEPAGMLLGGPGLPDLPGSPYLFMTYYGNRSGVLDGIFMYVEAFPLPGGRAAGLQLTVEIVYQPARTPEETVSNAVRLVLTPTAALNRVEPMTITRPTEIAQVEQIINALPTWPLRSQGCDSGNGLGLTFESATGSVLLQMQITVEGGSGAVVTVGGKPQPELAAGPQTVADIQQAVGTDWFWAGPAP